MVPLVYMTERALLRLSSNWLKIRVATYNTP